VKNSSSIFTGEKNYDGLSVFSLLTLDNWENFGYRMAIVWKYVQLLEEVKCQRVKKDLCFSLTWLGKYLIKKVALQDDLEIILVCTKMVSMSGTKWMKKKTVSVCFMCEVDPFVCLKSYLLKWKKKFFSGLLF